MTIMTRIQRVYRFGRICILGQWFFTFWVFGVTATSLHLSDGLQFIVPMLGYIVSVAAIHVVVTYFSVKAKTAKPASPTDPRPSLWYILTYSVSSLMWFTTMACVVLVLVRTMPFADEKDKEGGLRKCHSKYKTYKCYYSTNNAQVNTLAKINTAATSFIIIFVVAHWFEISKLWWQKFTPEEIGEAYDLNGRS
ncbi:hypothetical protein PMG11_07565 [Penicillium brasilianum]|uniref:MARVEL domain-containing protein n=1 Tax=Penicillium brasilianum TaxID=104259 RepID=A0A0F7TU60_PENBI|nr:hypothetical protein PMG11_07565 [Penicillium brasilianum]